MPRPDDAKLFKALHGGPDPLILANCWDAGSARLIETAGAKALATSSAAVAWCQGYADGDILPVARLVDVIAQIVRVTSLPLTTDIEGGYSDDLGQVAETVTAVVGAGAVGVNIEDADKSPDLLCAKIEAARKAADKAGVHLFINARTDVYLARLAEGEAALAEILARAAKYKAAGADGLFVPAIWEEAAIKTVVEGAGLPVNVLAWPRLPSLADLKRLGVRRLSAGASISRAALATTLATAKAFMADGDPTPIHAAAQGLGDMNALFPAP